MVRVVLPNGVVTWSTLREKQLWRYLNSVQDNFWRISDWPEWAQKLMMSHHIEHKTGYPLFCFLVWNGLHPDRAAKYMRLVDWKADTGLLVYTDNKFSRYQAEYMAKRFKEKVLLSQNQRIFDIAVGKTVRVGDFDY